MSWTKWHADPTPAELRQFAAGLFVAAPLLGWLLARSVAAVGVGIGVAMLANLAAWTQPAFVRPVFLAVAGLTYPIRWLMAEAILALIYFGVFTPLALWFRLIGRDALELKFDRQASTYWRPKARPRDVKQYYRQF